MPRDVHNHGHFLGVHLLRPTVDDLQYVYDASG